MAETGGLQVDRVFLAKSRPKFLPEMLEAPKLRILGFSIICYSPRGTPKPEENPVVIISVMTNTGDKRQFIAETSDRDDKIINEFVSYVRKFDPDIIVGYETNRNELPYLIARAKKNGITLGIDRANTEPHRSVYGHISVTGRANIDLFDFADEFPEVKVKTLENIADYLGIMKIEERTLIEDVDFTQCWESPNKRQNLSLIHISEPTRRS